MPLKSPELTKFTTASPIISSVSYSEIASGEGIVSFLGYTTADSVTNPDYKISANAFKSSGSSSGRTLNNTSNTVTYNFDSSQFNIARDLGGTATIGFLLSVTNGSVGAAESYVTFTIYHYDGTTYTSLGTKQSQTMTETAPATTQYMSGLLEIDMTEQHFAVGDSIRVKVDHFGSSGGVSNKSFVFYHDPKDTIVGSVHGSQFKINIPFATDNI